MHQVYSPSQVKIQARRRVAALSMGMRLTPRQSRRAISRYRGTPCRASSMARTNRPKNCCSRWMRSMVSSRKGRTAQAVLGCVAAQQAQQRCPRDDRIHLIEELALASALDGQLESGVGKADLVHGCSFSCKAFVGLTFAEFPQQAVQPGCTLRAAG